MYVVIIKSALCEKKCFTSGTDFELFDLQSNRKICKIEFTLARFLFGQTLPAEPTALSMYAL